MSNIGKRSFVSMERTLAIGLVAALVLAGMAGSAGAAVSGLVAEWHFDGSAQDTSGNGNNGTINGAAFVQGISGQALSFNGVDDMVVVPHSPSLSLDKYTLEAWIKRDQNRELVATEAIIVKRYEQSWMDNYGLYIYPNGKVAASSYSPDIWTWFDLTSAKNISAGEWYHIAATYDRTTLKIYINGVLDNSVNTQYRPYQNNYQLVIGRACWGDPCLFKPSNPSFNGIIDEVRIYNRALSASEIQAEYNALIYTPATVTPNTVLLDDFNGATKGKGFGALTYVDSQPNLGKAVNLAKGTYIKYSFSPWYTWDGNHKWDRNEAASGVLTEGRIEMWIKPRQYSGILNFNWGDAVSSPPAGHIMHFGFNADGKLAYSVWGGNLDKGLVGKTTIPLNKWTHVAVSWSPYGTKLYVNGEVDASTSANVWPAFSGTVFAYLNYWGGNDLGFVDDFHISKVAEPAPTVPPTTVPPTTVPPTITPTITTPPPPTCEGPKGKFETALKNFREAEDRFKVAEEQFIRDKEAIPRDENRHIIKKELWRKFVIVIREFFNIRIDLLIADIELLKCDAKFTEKGENLPFDVSSTMDKHKMELENIRTKLQRATEDPDIRKIDRDLKDIYEKLELEIRYYKGIGVNNNIDIFFASTDDASVRMNEIIKKLNGNGKDTSKLTAIASDFNNIMKEAKDEHKKTLDLFREHSGFDSAGMVTDIRKAQDFVRQIKEQQKDTKRMKSAIAKLREFFGESKRLIQSTSDSTAPVTGGVKT